MDATTAVVQQLDDVVTEYRRINTTDPRMREHPGRGMRSIDHCEGGAWALLRLLEQMADTAERRRDIAARLRDLITRNYPLPVLWDPINRTAEQLEWR